MQPQTATTRPAPLITLGEIIATGELQGYEPGAPDPMLPDAAMHARLVREMACPSCGEQKISWRPFIRVRGGHGYRGYGRCRTCGHTEAL